MRTCTLVLLLTFAANTTGVPGVHPLPPACSNRVGTAAAIAVEDHARHDSERPTFAKSWVSVVRGGASRVPADGGGGARESASKRGGVGGREQEVELALTGNFPNR